MGDYYFTGSGLLLLSGAANCQSITHTECNINFMVKKSSISAGQIKRCSVSANV
jgi:hypothetical protein